MKRAVFMLALWLSACAPQTQPYQAAPGAEASLDGGYLIAADGARLPLKSWLPEGKPRAVIVALHGFNDYSNAFKMPGEFFRKRGVATYAYDQRGFGASPHTGIWAGEENLVHDLRQCVRQLKKRHPDAPVYVLGESMGGAVAIAALADDAFPSVDGLILLAPAVWGDDAMSPLMRGSLWLLAHTLPFYTMTGEDLRIRASDNTAMLIALSYDPLVIKETRADAVYGLVGLMGNAYRKAPQVKTRTLLLYGDRDEVIPRRPVEQVAARYTAPLAAIYYPHGYHMLLRDLQRERVMRDILQWMTRKKSA